MNGALAATCTAGATVMYWMIADDAASRRKRVVNGTGPRIDDTGDGNARGGRHRRH
jgi:hypothetical protein